MACPNDRPGGEEVCGGTAAAPQPYSGCCSAAQANLQGVGNWTLLKGGERPRRYWLGETVDAPQEHWSMARMPHEPEAFCEAVMALMLRLSPDRKVELAGTFEMLIDGRHLALENLYRMVLNDPDRGVEIVEQFLDHLMEGEEAASVPLPFDVARPRIMPRIQPESIFQHLDAQLVAHQPFVNDTVVLYVIDMPHLTVSITVEQMLKWGVDVEEIDRTARRNLGAYSDELKLRVIEAGNGGRAAIFQENDGYDASRLLLGSLHGRLAPVLGSNFLVAAPARDAFLAVTADPAEFAEKVHSRVEIDYKRLPYPITDRFFIVTMDGIAGTIAA